VLVEFGDTKVLCTASIDEGVPRFLKGQGQCCPGYQLVLIAADTGERFCDKSRLRRGLRPLTHFMERMPTRGSALG